MGITRAIRTTEGGWPAGRIIERLRLCVSSNTEIPDRWSGMTAAGGVTGLGSAAVGCRMMGLGGAARLGVSGGRQGNPPFRVAKGWATQRRV
jgi:hypothetical protein